MERGWEELQKKAEPTQCADDGGADSRSSSPPEASSAISIYNVNTFYI